MKPGDWTQNPCRGDFERYRDVTTTITAYSNDWPVVSRLSEAQARHATTQPCNGHRIEAVVAQRIEISVI
jgi:hypothetical protein